MQEAPAALVSWIRGLIHKTTAAPHSHTCSRKAPSLQQQYIVGRETPTGASYELGYNIDCYNVINTMEAIARIIIISLGPRPIFFNRTKLKNCIWAWQEPETKAVILCILFPAFFL